MPFLGLFLHILAAPFKSQARLEAEIVFLRHQLNVLHRRIPANPRLTVADRLLLVWLYRLFPSLLNVAVIVQPETIVRWHRSGFRLYWRWKSRSRGGRPKVPVEIRRLIREMSLANSLWGAPRIHGELLKLGIEVAQSTVAKYMARRGGGSSQTWKAFLCNHAAGTDDVVELPGWLPADRLAAMLPRAAAFVAPSRISANGDRDGIPNVVLEAMAARLPVVGTDVSGIPEAVADGVTGLLVPAGNAAALADALQRILAGPGTGREMGEAGRQRVLAGFDLMSSSRRLAELFSR